MGLLFIEPLIWVVLNLPWGHGPFETTMNKLERKATV